MSNQCLFCTKRATTSCCLTCRQMNRSSIFEELLTLLTKATKYDNYYHQIKIICERIQSLEWSSLPFQFTPFVYFDPTVHKIDCHAKSYLEKASSDVRDMVPIDVHADGNCLYNSIICLNAATVVTPIELRVRTIIELIKNEVFYSNRYTYVVGRLDEAVKNACRNFSFSELYEIVALTNVLKCNIQSIYPIMENRPDLDVMNKTFHHIECNNSSRTIRLFWTHTLDEMSVRCRNAGNWSPNHFVPLLCSSDNISSSSNQCLNVTPTKLTVKNNNLAQIRIPQFELNAAEIQPTIPSIVNTPTMKRFARNVRLESIESSAENQFSTDMEGVEIHPIVMNEINDKEKSIPEKAERRRALARERSANRRAIATSEEIERQRALARERSANRRATTTSEETERQRALARERSANRRAIATSEKIEQQRALARERSANKRANAISGKVKQRQLLGQNETNPRKSNNSTRERSRTETSEDNDTEWPKPVELEHKIHCLKDFIRSMSMDCLGEGVCGICNIRCFIRDLRCLPLAKIPSIEVLKAHEDFYGRIPGMRDVNNWISTENRDIVDDIDKLIAGNDKRRDENTQYSETKSSFICINNIILYEKGLRRNFDRRKRLSLSCNICMECWSSLAKEKIPKFSPANKVWIGDVPRELQGLTIPEQKLIALYRHNSCIVKLHSSFHSACTAQSALRGNCISFPQDVGNIATSLPLQLDDLCDSLKILFVGHQPPRKSQVKNILTVRKRKVCEALQWLKQNNLLYRNIQINYCRIANLPDDDVPECLWSTMQISTDVESSENERSSYIPSTLINPSGVNVTETVPLITSAVLDVNGVNISSDDVTEHLMQQVTENERQMKFKTDLGKNAKENTVYIIPRGNTPANEYFNLQLLPGIFPTLFPYGCGGLEDSSRPIKINFREHLKYLLSYNDRRFEENNSFIYVVFNILQRRTACFQAQLLTTRPYFEQSAQLIESLSSEDVAKALVNISKGTYAKVTDQKIGALMKHLRIVGGHVMGSAHSRSALRVKIHSLCFYLGLPSLFVTINPADIHSPVALYFAGINLDLDKIVPEALGTSYERAQTIATHPVATAKFFNSLIKNILKCLILGGVLGPTKGYFGTVENQGRGSLHLHLLIWLNHDFTPMQLKDQVQSDDFRTRLLQYLEDIVKEDLDNFRDVTTDQMDTTNGNTVVNGNIESAMNEIIPTCLPTPNPSLDNFSEIFRKDIVRLVETCNIHKHSATCYKYSKSKPDGSKTCRMRMPRALVSTSSINPSTGQILMRRSHPWINNFNEWLISACRSNMDIKFIWNGGDAKALVYYITDYVTKSSLPFHDMFALAQKGIRSIEQQKMVDTNDSAVEKSRKLVLRCYNMIASHQEVSGVQVASYLMNYGDHYTTHTFRNLFLASVETYLQKDLDRARLQEINIDHEQFDNASGSFDDEQEENAEEFQEKFILERTEDGSKYVIVNIRLDYQYRSKDLTELCLYDFVSQFHKKIIDKADRRVLKDLAHQEGKRLSTEGTRMNERHTFESAHPQSSSHILIKHTNRIVPVLVGPQIPRRDREETRERYCRAVLTLFVPWRTVYDLCTLNESWSDALEARKLLISSSALKIIDNIQLLHECKSERDEHLLRVITEIDNDGTIDPILIPECNERNTEDLEDDSEELLEMISFVDETTTKKYSVSLNTPEQRYLHEALQIIDETDRFSLLNGHKHFLNKDNYHVVVDSNTFVTADTHHTAMIKEWKQDIENRKNQARKVLIMGDSTLVARDNEVEYQVEAVDISASLSKEQNTTVPPVTTTTAFLFPSKMDIVKDFTLNKQQEFAFMIITSHLDKESQFHIGTVDNQLLMCVPGCGGTGKSQLIRAITKYFQVTNRSKMLRKLAPTSIAAGEIDGLTIHSFLGENRKYSKKQARTFRPGDAKLENEWRYVEYLIIDEMSMVGLSLLSRLNLVIKTAKHINSDVPFAGINVIFFGDYLQYSPVLDKPLYDTCMSTKQYTTRQIEMQCAQKIMSQINSVVELHQQMRTEDKRYLELLVRLRNGQSTIEDYQLLCTRVIGTPGLSVSLQKSPWNESPILVFRNMLRTQINNRAVLNKALEMGVTPTVCVAQDYVKGALIDNLRLRKAVLDLPDNRTEHLPGYLPLVPGMPVLLTENIATELGLSNGTRGIFRQLVYEESPDNNDLCDTIFPQHTKFITQPKYALVEFSNCKLDSKLGKLEPKVIPVAVSEQTFLFDVKDLLHESASKAAKITKRSTKISIKRKALPLIPAYSITTHKSQGQTMGKIIVDLVMPPGPVEVASAYVPLSRVKRLDDLIILRPFDFLTLQVKPSTAQIQELNRLNLIAESTRKRYFPIN